MGELLNHRYELGAVIGSGGMGAVYRARDTRLGRAVAVKVLRAGPLADDVARSRLRSEASLAASINHPGVAHVFDYEEDPATHGGLAFIVMELVEGHSLAELLREQGPMPTDQVMSVVVQVAEGLQAAHEAGVVHRDLKPANIMLTPAGRTVLVDFGIARSAASEPLTSTGSLIGTADYMSPEQAAGRSGTPQSDLYALGVVAHHCLTGESPFRRDSQIATALAHLNDDLPPLTGVPLDVRTLIERLTAKNPSDRPSSAAVAALEAARIGAAARIDLPDTFEIPAEEPSTETSVGVPAAVAAPRDRRRPIVLAAVGAVAAGLVVLGLQHLPGDDPAVVPRVVGMDVAEASAAIRDEGLAPRTRSVDVAGQAKGTVVEQSPAAGRERADGEPVRMSVASGKVVVSAGKIIGLTYAKASAALEKLGFEVERKDVVQAGDTGEVVALDRSGRLPDGTTVVVSVATAPAVVTGPDTSTSDVSSDRTPTGNKSVQPKPKGKAKGKSKGKKK